MTTNPYGRFSYDDNPQSDNKAENKIKSIMKI